MKHELKDKHKIFEHIIKRSSSEQEILFNYQQKEQYALLVPPEVRFPFVNKISTKICPMHDILDVKFNLCYTNHNFKN